ncbi:MAG: hypothetical protein Q8P03_01135 [bacterium]|nr:hypothetical protein [bacterium]
MHNKEKVVISIKNFLLMKKAIIGGIVCSAFLVSFAFAHEETGVQRTAQDVRQNVLEQTVKLRQEAVDRFKIQRQEAETQLRAKKVELQDRVKTAREEMKSKIEAKRVELKDRLQSIRDEKKQQTVERVYDKVNQLNERMTLHFMNALTQIEEVLGRVESRADKAEANGLDVSAARAAIAAAETAIQSARTAVEAQAGKTYSFTVTTEEDLRSDVGQARKTLHDDLTAVREIVRAARDAVRQAAVALAQIPRVDEAEVTEEE